MAKLHERIKYKKILNMYTYSLIIIKITEMIYVKKPRFKCARDQFFLAGTFLKISF